MIANAYIQSGIAIKMKSTEVQTLGALWRGRVSKRTTNWWAGFILAVTRGLLPARAESDAG